MSILHDAARKCLNMVREAGKGFLEPEDEVGLAVLAISELVVSKLHPEGKPLQGEKVLELEVLSLELVLANDVHLAERAGILPRLDVTPKEEIQFAWAKYEEWRQLVLYPATKAVVYASRPRSVPARQFIIGFLWMYFVHSGSARPDIEQGLRVWNKIMKENYGSANGTIAGDVLDGLWWAWEQNGKRPDTLFFSPDHHLKFGDRQLRKAFDRAVGRKDRKTVLETEAEVRLEDHLQGSEEQTLLDTVPDARALDPIRLLVLRELRELRDRVELPALLSPAFDALELADVEALTTAVERIRALADLLRGTQDPALAAALLCEGFGIDGRGGSSPTRGAVAAHYGVTERQLAYRAEAARKLLPRWVA